MKRQRIVAGNWKMNKTFSEGIALATAIAEKKYPTDVTVILTPPYTHLHAVGEIIKNNPAVHLAAQNCHQKEKGAYTGEISIDMLISVGVEYVILGHSERRQYFKEDDALLAQKVDLVLSKGLRPIFCCGESLDIRQSGKHVEFVGNQLKNSLFHLSVEDFQKVVIAYEPIWAIGTGVTASTQQAEDTHAALRQLIAKKYGEVVAEGTTILYGGSCKPTNAKSLFSQSNVDGGLIGGASLKADDFAAIINSY